jgi:hypothetical protein
MQRYKEENRTKLGNELDSVAENTIDVLETSPAMV